MCFWKQTWRIFQDVQCRGHSRRAIFVHHHQAILLVQSNELNVQAHNDYESLTSNRIATKILQLFLGFNLLAKGVFFLCRLTFALHWV